MNARKSTIGHGKNGAVEFSQPAPEENPETKTTAPQPLDLAQLVFSQVRTSHEQNRLLKELIQVLRRIDARMGGGEPPGMTEAPAAPKCSAVSRHKVPEPCVNDAGHDGFHETETGMYWK